MGKYIYIILGLILYTISSKSFALTEIQALEEKLVNEGESAQILFAIATNYLQTGDIETTQLYLDYLKGYLKNNPSEATKYIEKIKLIETELKDYKKIVKSQDSQTLVLIEGGYDSNANRGATIDTLNFILDSGETLFLDIDDESKDIGSSFLSTSIIHNRLIENSDFIGSVAIENIQYQNRKIPDSNIARMGLSWKNQNLYLFNFRNYENINGILYSGRYHNFNWALRKQTDRNIYKVGLQTALADGNNLKHHLSFKLGKDLPTKRNERAGGTINRAEFAYTLVGQKYRLRFYYELGKDEDFYNSFFFRDIKEEYKSNNISFEYEMVKSKNMQLSLKADYFNKSSNINLNDWQGTSISLKMLKLF